MRNLSIKTKVIGIFCVLLLIMTVLGFVAILKMSVVNDQSTIIAENWLPSVALTSDMNTNTSDYRIAQGAHIMSTADADMTRVEADMKAVSETLAANRKAYEPLISSDEERALYQDFSRQWDNYLAISQEMIALSRQNQNEQAAQLFKGDLRTSFDAASANLLKLVELNRKGADDASRTGDEIYAESRMIVIGTIAAALLIMTAAGYLLIRGISTPIGALRNVMTVLATGKLDEDVPYTDQNEEIGSMAKAVMIFRDSMIQARDLAAREQAEQARQVERGKRMAAAVTSFDKLISEIAGAVGSAATELQSTAQSLSSTAEETAQQATAVAAASEQTTQNVQTVASATEELSASIREISGQVAESNRIVAGAVSQAGDTNAKVKMLAEAAHKIGEVVTLINEIASQTNLLALNATIEAARAGEAGKGFAVVASEVKNLATQTARATEEIAGQIRSIQEATDTSVQAIDAIVHTINRVNEISTAIASAVEEQGAATLEISRNVQEASTGTAEVSANIAGVTMASQQTSSGSAQVLSAASELAVNGERLKKEVDTFLTSVRAA